MRWLRVQIPSGLLYCGVVQPEGFLTLTERIADSNSAAATMEQTIFGIPIRVSNIVPDDCIGVNNGKYLTLFWQGAEIARVSYGEVSEMVRSGAANTIYRDPSALFASR